MPAFATLADLPTLLEGDQPRSRIPVAMLGSFKDRRYGRFTITTEQLANWRRLLTSHFHGRVPIDEDHLTDKGISSKARGWITSLSEPDHDQIVWADVEWTPDGEKLVRDREFAYISPTFVDNLKDDQERPLGPALLRAALTNSPFLHRMPAISLAAAAPEFAEIDTEPGADSRRAMSLTAIAQALGLQDDADEAKILETLKARPTPSGGEGTPKTLEQQAADSGKVLLSAEQVATLTEQANAGAAAAQQLKTQRFEDAYTRALDRLALDTSDETRELYASLYEADQDRTVKVLDNLKPIVNARPRGAGGHDADPDVAKTLEIDGKNVPVDESSARLLAKAEQIAADTGGDVIEIAMRLDREEGALV